MDKKYCKKNTVIKTFHSIVSYFPVTAHPKACCLLFLTKSHLIYFYTTEARCITRSWIHSLSEKKKKINELSFSAAISACQHAHNQISVRKIRVLH